MPTIVVSDLHIGSPYFKHEWFRQFLEALPADSRLVLNGDTIDNPRRQLAPPHRQVLDALIALGDRLPVVWVEGNHDQGYRPPNPGKIVFKQAYALGDRRLFITHGAYFDNVMPYNRWFIQLFRVLHELRMRLGAPPVHVAEYAKKWQFLYRYLNRNVRMNAVEYAREHGYRAVACGHVHHVEHTVIDGIEYINTGAWTESPTCYLSAVNDELSLLEWRGDYSSPSDGTNFQLSTLRSAASNSANTASS